MKPREQTGHITEAFGAFHIRYWVAYSDLHPDEQEKIARKCEQKNKALPDRVQKSERLCDDTVSRKERDKLIKAVMDRVNDHTPGEPIIPEMTLVDYWEKQYLPWAIANKKPSTAHGYKQSFMQHIAPKLGKHPIKNISTPMVTKLLGQLAEDGQAESTIQHAKWIGSGLYIHAIAKGFATSNPWPGAQCLVKTPRAVKREAYSATEALDIIAAIDRADAKLAFSCACFLGMRKGEIQVLRWEDFVDLEVRIERAISRKVVLDETKTGKARRGLIIEPVKSLLQSWRELSGNPTSGWLFPNGRHHPLSLDSMAQRLIIPKLNKPLRWLGWQAARKACSTILTELTGDALAARDILGHSTTQVTESHYIAPIPEAGRKGMVAMDAHLKSLKEKKQ